MNILKIRSFSLLWILLIAVIGITGCSATSNDNGDSSAPLGNAESMIINASEFSRLSSQELIANLGEPEKIEDYGWKVPKSGESIVGKLYVYEKNKYEFILFDDSVARLNVYSGSYMGYSDDKFSFESKDSLFQMFGIEKGEHLKKIEDNTLTLRYSPVSDKVADFWINNILDGKFDLAKITYNLNYF
ncbi:hypothetical protein ACP8HI_04505 [Paenibacillus sp. FA6]|uniref:hypothetical protein n=1 Tax=Paenibacillus sp. FA6 TaxID=3413029 RepID=UPI003F65E540